MDETPVTPLQTEPPGPPSIVATTADWEAIRLSRPSDYDGHTGFAQMTPTARLAWLEDAVEFVSRYSGPSASASAKPPS
jgi:hypothetical protein